MCGEQSRSFADGYVVIGSSPRVRGTARQDRDFCRLIRFIPACAGNSLAALRTDTLLSVHPRVCGEQRVRTVTFAALSGSSPRVQGTVTAVNFDRDLRRFIPACAGNSHQASCRCVALSVHPRVCGEQDLSLIGLCRSLGSSPRVRGTASCCDLRRCCYRFIPACAGNSAAAPIIWRNGPVHPRVCGEQSRTYRSLDIATGSSPRVRGTAWGYAAPDPAGRFIPACAGNSFQRRSSSGTRSVHPRVCGEQIPKPHHFARDTGSSPRVRGTAAGAQAQVTGGRFIPACAGNSRNRGLDFLWAPVHPRVCGEQRNSIPFIFCPSGSSPRVRGTVF